MCKYYAHSDSSTSNSLHAHMESMHMCVSEGREKVKLFLFYCHFIYYSVCIHSELLCQQLFTFIVWLTLWLTTILSIRFPSFCIRILASSAPSFLALCPLHSESIPVQTNVKLSCMQRAFCILCADVQMHSIAKPWRKFFLLFANFCRPFPFLYSLSFSALTTPFTQISIYINKIRAGPMPRSPFIPAMHCSLSISSFPLLRANNANCCTPIFCNVIFCMCMCAFGFLCGSTVSEPLCVCVCVCGSIVLLSWK